MDQNILVPFPSLKTLALVQNTKNNTLTEIINFCRNQREEAICYNTDFWRLTLSRIYGDDSVIQRLDLDSDTDWYAQAKALNYIETHYIFAKNKKVFFKEDFKNGPVNVSQLQNPVYYKYINVYGTTNFKDRSLRNDEDIPIIDIVSNKYDGVLTIRGLPLSSNLKIYIGKFIDIESADEDGVISYSEWFMTLKDLTEWFVVHILQYELEDSEDYIDKLHENIENKKMSIDLGIFYCSYDIFITK